MNMKNLLYLFMHGEESTEHEVAGDLHDLPDVVREDGGGGGEEEEEDWGQRHPDHPHSSHRAPGTQHGTVWKVILDYGDRNVVYQSRHVSNV